MHVGNISFPVYDAADMAAQEYVLRIVQWRPADICMEYFDRLLWRHCSSCLVGGNELHPPYSWRAIPLDLASGTCEHQENCDMDASLDHLVRLCFSPCGHCERDHTPARVPYHTEQPNLSGCWMAHLAACDSYVRLARRHEHVRLQVDSVDRDGGWCSSHLSIHRLCGGFGGHGDSKQRELCLFGSQYLFRLVRYIRCLEPGNADMCLVFYWFVQSS